MSSIDTGASYIGAILRDGKPYVVPKFQRDYSWTTDEVEQLWSDIFQVIKDRRPSYFIGSIVINDGNATSYSVIDGQQRLTTISLLICALRDIANERGSNQLADRLAGDFLGKFEYATGETSPKLTLNVVNRKFYSEKIVNSLALGDLEAFVKNTRNNKSNRLIAGSYLYLRRSILEELEGGMQFADFIQQIVTALDDVVQVIKITVKDDYDAYMLFETLNDRGLALSVADLLKNYLFSKADDKIEDVQENWQEMIDNLGKLETKRYLRHFWLSKYGVVRDKELYSRIKDKFVLTSSVVAFSRDLRDSSEFYSALSDPKSSTWTLFEGHERVKIERLIDDLCLFGVNQYNPLLLAVLESNPKIFTSVLRMVVSFAFRYSIIMGKGPGNIERNFSEAAVFARGNPECSAADIFSKVRHLFPSDADFGDAFEEKSITHSSIARYILRSVNDKLEEDSGLVVNKDGFTMTLGHVLPQKYRPEDWSAFGEGVDPGDFVHRIGNMTLLTSGLNRRVSNGSFPEKRQEYQRATALKISEEIFSSEDWTAARVRSRQERLAKVAKQIWRVDY